MITAEEIEAAKTAAGGWTREQLEKWGVPWPPPKGWRNRLLGGDHCTNAWEKPSAGGIVEIAEIALKLKPQCESPIEVALGAYLLQAMGWDRDLAIVPQFKFGRFRYDFAIWDEKRARAILLIECDGKEFHSSPEQIANDRSKDEIARRGGFGIIRFSGRDINRDPRNCALIALDLARQLKRSKT